MDRRRFVSGVAGGASVLLAGCTSGGSDEDDPSDEDELPEGNTSNTADEQNAWSDDDLPSAVDEDGTVDWDEVIDATSAAVLDASFETEYRWSSDGSSEEYLHTRADHEARELYYDTVEGAGAFEFYVRGDEAHVLADGSYDEDGEGASWDFDDAVDRIGVALVEVMLDGLRDYELSIDAVTDERVELAIDGGDGGAFPHLPVADGTITLAEDGRLVSHAATGESGESESYDVDPGPVSVPRPDWVDEHA